MGNDALVSLDDLPPLDVRTVAIIWSDGDARPQVITSKNMSQFEALGLLRPVVRRLERDCEDLIDFEDDEQDDDDADDYDF